MNWSKVFKMSAKEKKLLTQSPTVRLKEVVTSENDLPHCLVVSTIDGELTLPYKGKDELWDKVVEGLTKQKGMVFDVATDETFGVSKSSKKPTPVAKQTKAKAGCFTQAKPKFEF